MCTNYVPSRGARLNEQFGILDPGFAWRDEVWPGHLAPMIRPSHEDRRIEIAPACFGLIPGWSRDGRNYRFCYNARSETVAEKPSFRNAWRRRQLCLIPADAFFEPCYESGRAVRWRIELANGEALALAGIWEAWRRREPASDGADATADAAAAAAKSKAARPRAQSFGPPDAKLIDDDWILSFSLLTVNADRHPVMRRFHGADDEKRSVVHVPHVAREAWLAGDQDIVAQVLGDFDQAALESSAAPLPPRKPAPPKPRRKAKPADQ